MYLVDVMIACGLEAFPLVPAVVIALAKYFNERDPGVSAVWEGVQQRKAHSLYGRNFKHVG